MQLNAPRAYTPEEVQQMLLLYFRTMVSFWSTLNIDSADLVKAGQSDVEYRLSGLVFGVLRVFDGAASPLPAFDIRPVPHPEDQTFHESAGRNWFEMQTINDCQLHELWSRIK